VRLRLLEDVRYLPEDADDSLALAERDGADLDCQAVSRFVDEDDRRIAYLVLPEQVARVDLPGAARVLGRDDGRELATDLVADNGACGSIHPPDHADVVEDVARYVDMLERAFDVCAHRLGGRYRHR
jgi:hypothetical protein